MGPKNLQRLLRRVRDWALVNELIAVDADSCGCFRNVRVDARGLDRLDRSVLDALCTKFNGGPVGLSTLAIAVGEEVETVETAAEPYLVREGLLGRTPRGRIAMPAAWEHLGLNPPQDPASEGLWSLLQDGASPSSESNHEQVALPQEDTEGLLFFDDRE